MQPYLVRFAPEVADDLAAIRDFIALRASPKIAEQFVDRIITHCEGFAIAPARGTRRDDIRMGLRTSGWRRTVTIAFRLHEKDVAVDIVGIFYRGRDVEAAMAQRTPES